MFFGPGRAPAENAFNLTGEMSQLRQLKQEGKAAGEQVCAARGMQGKDKNGLISTRIAKIA